MEECEKYGNDKFDHLVIYLSAGGLGLLLTLVDKLGSTASISHKIFFTAAVTFFTLALILEFISHFYSFSIARKSKYLTIEMETAYFDEKADKRIGFLNFVSLIFVIIGIVSTFLLVVSNLWH